MARQLEHRPVTLAINTDDLAQRYRDGASLLDLAILCDCSSGRIRSLLVAAGVEIRPRGHNPGGNRPNKFLRR